MRKKNRWMDDDGVRVQKHNIAEKAREEETKKQPWLVIILSTYLEFPSKS